MTAALLSLPPELDGHLASHAEPVFSRSVLDRAADLWPVAMEALAPLYQHDPRWPEARDHISKAIIAAAGARDPALVELDVARAQHPDWFLDPRMAGYSTYVDRFAGSLTGVADRIDYLKELGINVLHLLPIMRVREGANDGGFAMESHLEVDPRWGTGDDLRHLAGALRASGISLTLDLLCNHTASTHPWAKAALAGDPRYGDHYLFFGSREETRRFEPFLDQVFPQTAPGNFTQLESDGRWVWTTFYPYQWDLNFANPLVFADMLEVILKLANLGAETLRLDSVAYLWKAAGTACKNLPQAHNLLTAWSALSRIVAPGLLLKAEAIVETAITTAYLGREGGPGECQLAYNNPLMIALWSAQADGDASELVGLFDQLPIKPSHTSWINYVRCHDDIGWALLGKDRGREGAARALFLSDFYSGETEGSWATGGTFQSGPGQSVHGGIGMTSSLAGLESARWDGDPAAIQLAIARILQLHALAAACPGTPTLWMGDEIGLGSSRNLPEGVWAAEDQRSWNRPFMDWEAAALRHEPDTVENALFAGIRHILAVRAATPAFHAANPVERPRLLDQSVAAFKRGRGSLIVVANLGTVPVALEPDQIGPGMAGAVDRLTGRRIERSGPISVRPYGVLWLDCQA